jgi:N6-L-threonylcarbamoyladenine synthase
LRVVQKYSGAETLNPADPKTKKPPPPLPAAPVADIAASFQMAVVDILVSKTRAAAEQFNVAEVLLAGGVAANSLLRSKMGSSLNRPVLIPPLWLCTDNAAMIGAAAHWRLQAGQASGWDLDVVANLRLDSK